MVLPMLDGNEATRIKRSKPLNADQKTALEALRNAMIDRSIDRVAMTIWSEEHRAKCPDLDRRRAQEARHSLIEARIVGSDKHTAWVINENK